VAGILRDLEHYRLSKKDKATLRMTDALIDQLIGLKILPGSVADVLAVFRDDVGAAIAAKEGPVQAAAQPSHRAVY
jgi:hypothetical protein